MAKRWHKCISSIAAHGTPGNCPSCKSEYTDYVYVICSEHNSFLHMWCNACGRGEQVCGRGKPPEGWKTMTGDEYAAWKYEGGSR